MKNTDNTQTKHNPEKAVQHSCILPSDHSNRDYLTSSLLLLCSPSTCPATTQTVITWHHHCCCYGVRLPAQRLLKPWLLDIITAVAMESVYLFQQLSWYYIGWMQSYSKAHMQPA